MNKRFVRYVCEFLNGDIAKGAWIDTKKITIKNMQFTSIALNTNRIIKNWSVEYK